MEEEDVPMDTPEIMEAAAKASSKMLPQKSRDQYERAYNLFMEWRRNKQTVSFSERVILAYFQELAAKMKPSSLWAIYSMLRKTINVKHNINMRKYPKLSAFLKRTSDGYKPKKSKTLTPQQIKQFLSSAPDVHFLFTKVGLIFGIMGACRREELWRIETTHVEDINTALLVHIPDTKTKIERIFVIGDNYYQLCKKYMNLRPPDVGNNNRFFLNYQLGRCTKQPIGINKFGSIPSEIAIFLNLPNPTSYTGHCMRLYSPTILLDSSVDITALKPHGRLQSTSFTEGCEETTINKKLQTVEEIGDTVQGTSASASTNFYIKEEITETNSKNVTNTNNICEAGVEEIGDAVQGTSASASTNVYIKEEITDTSAKNATNINITYEGGVEENGGEAQGSSASATTNIYIKDEIKTFSKKATNINIVYESGSSNIENTSFVEKRLISFTNCQNVSNITVNVYLPK